MALSLAASEEGSVVGTVILEAAANSEEQLDSILGRLDFRDPAHNLHLFVRRAGNAAFKRPVPEISLSLLDPVVLLPNEDQGH